MRPDYDHQPPPPRDFSQQIAHHEPKKGKSSIAKYFVFLFFGLELVMFGLLFYVMAVPEAVGNFTPLFCPENTTLVSESRRVMRRENSLTFHCVDDGGREVKDVTPVLIAVFVVGSLVLTSLGMLAVMRVAANKVKDTKFQVNTGTSHTQMSFSDLATLARTMNNASTTGNKSPTERLSELQAAYDAGLINETEYQRTRAEILSDF